MGLVRNQERNIPGGVGVRTKCCTVGEGHSVIQDGDRKVMLKTPGPTRKAFSTEQSSPSC